MIFNEWMSTTDVHVGGETFRFIDGSALTNEKHTPLILKRLLEEPRGHSGMRLCIMMAPTIPGADWKLTFIDTDGSFEYVEHGLFAASTLLSEMYGIEKHQFSFEVDGAVHKVAVMYEKTGEEIQKASFMQSVRCVPTSMSFENTLIDVYHAGQYIAVTDVLSFRLHLINNDLQALKKAARLSFSKLEQSVDNLKLVKRIVFYEKDGDGKYKYMTIEKSGRIDRSPFLGAWAVSAFLFNLGVIKSQSPFELSNFLNHKASAVITPNRQDLDIKVDGKGFIIGKHQFVIDSDDPLKDGFLLK